MLLFKSFVGDGVRYSVLVVPILFTYIGPADAGPCKCADKVDIENRIQESEAAIKEYQTQKRGMEAKEKRDGKPFKFSLKIYADTLQVRIQNVINAVTNPNARKATGETNDVTCQIEIRAPTACLAEAVRIHESQHQSYCRARAGVFTSYREGIRMIEVANDEITAYMAELDYLKTELQSAKANCTPPQPRRAYTSRIRRPGVHNAPPRWNNI
jgi:hypothetical protein